MVTRAGPQGAAGAKEEPVVAMGARRTVCPATCDRCVRAAPGRESAGYRLQLPSGSQRRPATVSARRQVCPRSESNRPAKCLKLPQLQQGHSRSTPGHTPTNPGGTLSCSPPEPEQRRAISDSHIRRQGASPESRNAAQPAARGDARKRRSCGTRAGGPQIPPCAPPAFPLAGRVVHRLG